MCPIVSSISLSGGGIAATEVGDVVKRSAFLVLLLVGLALTGSRAAACPIDDDCGPASYAAVEPSAPADYSWVGGTDWTNAYTVSNDVWTWNNGSTWEPSSDAPWPPSVPVAAPSLWDQIVNDFERIFAPAAPGGSPDSVGDRG